jgi:glycosyltransferase involved in cell wall biosynthesis
MKILHLSAHLSVGGAAIAAARLHQLLLSRNVNSSFLTVNAKTVHTPILPQIHSFPLQYQILTRLSRRFHSLVTPSCEFDASLELWDYSKMINAFEPDVLHLHWVAGQTFPFKSLKNINAKVIVTLHDSWLITNPYFHHPDINAFPFRFPYNIIAARSQLQIRKYSNKIRAILAPSQAQIEIIGDTPFKHCLHRVIPNPIPDQFRPSNDHPVINTYINSSQRNLPVLCLAQAGSSQPFIKGVDLLEPILTMLCNLVPFTIAIIGSRSILPRQFHDLIVVSGYLSDIEQIAKLYTLSSVTLVPSRFESFSLVAAESLACGTPVCGFTGSGLDSLIVQPSSGSLSPCYDIDHIVRSLYFFLSINRRSKRTSLLPPTMNTDCIFSEYISLLDEL